MAKSVTVASRTFPSIGAAKQFYRSIRDRYSDGERIPPEDDVCLRELVAIHHESNAKIGCGISHFTVETESCFGKTRHFTIHRIDGSSTDVSFISAIDGRNGRRDRLGALRRAVEDQILEFRASAFASGTEIVCPLRQVAVAETSYNVDHEAPWTFLYLVEEWLRAGGLTLDDLRITPPADNQIVTEMTDRPQLESWKAFHRTHARLRMLSPRANLSDAKARAGKRGAAVAGAGPSTSPEGGATMGL